MNKKLEQSGLNFSESKAFAESVKFDDKNLWVVLRDGRQLGVPLLYFPRLLNASVEERQKFTLSGGGIGIHWESLDEDISVPALVIGNSDQTKLGQSLL